MLPFLTGLRRMLQIVPSHPVFRLSQFGCLQFRGSLHESMQKYEHPSRVGEIKNSDFVPAVLRTQFTNLPRGLRRVWEGQAWTMNPEHLYECQGLRAGNGRERVQEFFDGSAAVRVLIKVNRPIHLYMVYL